MKKENVFGKYGSAVRVFSIVLIIVLVWGTVWQEKPMLVEATNGSEENVLSDVSDGNEQGKEGAGEVSSGDVSPGDEGVTENHLEDEQNAAATLVEQFGGNDVVVLDLNSNNDSGYYLDISNYKSTVPVYWDATTGAASYSGTKDGAKIKSVTLNNTSVAWGNSNGTSWTGGSALSAYYDIGSTTDEEEVELSITADDGYYVTRVIIACAPNAGNQTLDPYKCSTWKNGAAFIQNFSLTDSEYTNGQYTLKIDASNKYFSHNAPSAPNAYFILIQVAAVPTPLYVEYDYGVIGDYLTIADSAFATTSGWTDASSSNVYGTGGVLTEDTQFSYAYSEDNVDTIKSWTHYANSITSTALDQAEAVGYYFAGWEVTWYNDCTATQITGAAEGSNQYSLAFSDVYMTGTYASGDSVQLPTHVRLVAIWMPIELNVTKTVTGLSESEFASAENTYTIEVQKLEDDGATWTTYDTLTYTITGDGTLSQTISPIPGGSYRVLETDGNTNLTGTSEIMYISVYDGGQVILSKENTDAELTVTNSFSAEPAAYDLTVSKNVSGNMADVSREFTFTVSYGETTETFTLSHNGIETLENIPVGATVTIKESDADGYAFSVSSVNGQDEYTVGSDSNTITFTMPAENVNVMINNHKDATIDTGILLDSLPYILILGIVIAGVAILLLPKYKNMMIKGGV